MSRFIRMSVVGGCFAILVMAVMACSGVEQDGGYYAPPVPLAEPAAPAWPASGPAVAEPDPYAPAPPSAPLSKPAAPAWPASGPAMSESAPYAPAPSAPPRRPPAERRQASSVSLSAGEVDDNERWDDYLEYRRSYQGPYVHDVDVSERYNIRVLDRDNRPVPNARVWVSTERETLFEGRTYANGKTLFFPLAFSRQIDRDQTFRVYVEKDGVSQYLDAERRRGQEWVVKLDLRESYGRRVPLDVLFLVDSTGSMADEIGRIKETLLSISERIDALPSRPDLRFGMVTYRDRGDEYVTRMFDFNRDVRRFLRTIEGVRARGGGDYPESVNEALHTAVHRPDWRLNDAVRLVFLVADAPPHLDYSQDYDYATEMMWANRRGIKIFPIASSGLDEQGEYIFRQIAQHTMGKFIFLLYGGTTPHNVGQYTVQNLDDLVVRLIEDELAHLGGPHLSQQR